jgi:outer membrane protein OmpA-like peptidoglycan-associated protein
MMKCKYYVNLLLIYFYSSAVIAQDFIVEKLAPPVNTSFNEITPVISRDGTTLFFTRVGSPDYDRTLFVENQDISLQFNTEIFKQKLADIFTEMESEQVIVDAEKSDFNQEIWIATLDSTSIKSIEHPPYPLNNALPNSLVTITPDPTAFYILNQYEEKGGMKKGFSIIKKIPEYPGWSFPENINIEDYYTITSEVSLTMSFDGQILILSATRQDSENMDLYVCQRKDEKNWTAPKHLGSTINSPERETTPFLSEDNTTLYFSSNRNDENNDIYISKRLDDTWLNWSVPARLEAPINSKFDDSQPYFNMTTGKLFFTSKRDGSSDIFSVKIAPPQATEVTIKGRILHNQTGELIRKSGVRYSSGKNIQNLEISEDGNYQIKIPKGVKFNLMPEKSGYTGASEEVLIRRDQYFFQDFYIIDLDLEPLSKNAMIQLAPIYFQQSKSKILEKSYPELERLYSILEENPKLEIQIEGHTDNNGKLEDLIGLSEERAISVKNHLIKLGITSSRIKTIGYGSKFPLNDNSSFDLREKNRRVEFRITKT